MTPTDVTLIQIFISTVTAAVTTTAFLTWFIAGQFSKNRRGFYRVMSQHNREDDDRFLAIQESQWELREYIARRDGQKAPHRKPFPRRRYVVDDTGSDAEQSETA